MHDTSEWFPQDIKGQPVNLKPCPPLTTPYSFALCHVETPENFLPWQLILQKSLQASGDGMREKWVFRNTSANWSIWVFWDFGGTPAATPLKEKSCLQKEHWNDFQALCCIVGQVLSVAPLKVFICLFGHSWIWGLPLLVVGSPQHWWPYCAKKIG